MLGRTLETSFLARKLLEMACRAFRPALLKTLTECMMSRAVLFNGLPTKGLPGTIGCQIEDPQINTERIGYIKRFRSRHSKSHRKVEHPTAIEQVPLPSHRLQTSGLIRSYEEGNNDTPRKGQEADMRQSLKTHDPFILDNRSLWLKRRVDALVSFVGFTGLAETPDSQVSGKFIAATQLTIRHFLQRKLVRSFLSKSERTHVVCSLVTGRHGVKQAAVLLFG